MYDPLSIYYNKRKIVMNLGVGYFGYIENEIYNNYGSPYYFSNQTSSPVFNITLDYGITIKSAIGIATSYQEVKDFNENNQLKQGASVWNLGLRYTHSMGSWEFLYYGFRFGRSYWKYYLYGNGLPYSSLSYTTTIQFLLCARIIISKNIFIHLEAGALDPYSFEGGVTYRTDTRKKHQINPKSY